MRRKPQDVGNTVMSSQTTRKARQKQRAQVPAGVITMFGGSSAPSGWLLCQGQSLSTSTYPRLFAAIGYTHGGSGSTFQLPDPRGRAPIGAGQGSGLLNRTLGNTGGAEEVFLTTGEIPEHDHSVSSGAAGTHDHPTYANRETNTQAGSNQNRLTALQSTSGTAPDGSTGSAGSHSHVVNIGTTGGGGGHNNMQPWAAFHFIIKT